MEHVTEWIPAGADREIGAAQAFLVDREAVWIVRTGRLDVYAVEAVDGVPVGRRRHLFRVEAGSAVVGTADPERAGGERPRACRLLVVGSPGTNAVELSRVAFERVSRVPASAAALTTFVDGWVTTAEGASVRGTPPDECTELAGDVRGTLRRGASVRPADGDGVVWVGGVRQGFHLGGVADLAVAGDTELPLAANCWATLVGPGTVTWRCTLDVVGSDDLWAGLRQLQALVERAAAAQMRQALADEREHMALKQAAVRSTMRSAFSHLTGIFGRGSSPKLAPMRRRPPDAGATDAALYAAYRLVCNTMRIPVRLARDGVPGGTLADKVASLARVGRLRARQVALRDDWWATDSGPLLGETEDGKQPVALLPAARGGYLVYNPGERVQQTVTPAVARTLAAFAYTFTRSFPAGALALREVLRFGLQGCRRDLRMLLAMGIVTGVIGMLTPLLTGVIFNSVIPGAARGQLRELTGILIAAAFATTLFSIARAIALLRIEGRMGATIQAAVWDRLLSLPLPFYRDYTAGDLASRAMGVEEIRQVLSGATVTAMFGGLFSLFNFGLLFYYDARLAWWATGIIAVALAVTVLVSWLQRRDQREITRLRNRTSGLVLQFLTNIGKLRVAAAEVHAFALWVREFSQQRRLQFRVRAIGNGFAAFNAVLPVGSTMLLFGLVSAADPTAPPVRTGDFVGFLAAFTACLTAVLSTGAAIVGAMAIIPAYENVRLILEAAPEVDEARADPGLLNGDVELRNVSFSYRPDTPRVLHDLSLQVRRGDYVALVGPSGSGKSTILRLLLGFDVPDQGMVRYNGQDLASIDVQAVRRQIGVVLQNGLLTPGDIFSNVVGSTGATMDDAYEAVRMAGLADDIRQMPMGLHTIVSEGGGTLSGGQRQRLLIARAIVSRPRFVFFDEATSALDNRTQAIVTESLAHLRATRVVIAHRLSTIQHADRIYVVDRGAIVQSGRYEELMHEDGLFAMLARRQIA